MSENPYARHARQLAEDAGDNAAVATSNPYAQHARSQSEALHGAAVIAAERDPDQFARAQQLARRTGYPVEIVADHPREFEQRDAHARLRALQRDAPRTAAFLSDPRRMALAKDDLPALTKLSKAMQATTGGHDRSWSEFAADMGLRFKQFAREDALALADDVLVHAPNLPNRWLNAAASDLASIFGGDAGAGVPLLQRPQWLQRFRDETAALAADESERGASFKLTAQDAERPDSFVAGVGYMARNPSMLATDFAGSMGAMLGGGIVPGSAQRTIMLQAAGQAGMAAAEAEKTALDRGLSRQQAQKIATDTFALVMPVGVIAPRLVPGGDAMERVVAREASDLAGGSLRQAAQRVAGETFSETVEEGAVQAGQNVALGDPWSDGVGGAAAAGFGLGLSMGTVSSVAEALSPVERRQVAEGGRRLITSMADAQRGLAFTRAAGESKTVDRAASEVEALVGEETVYVPVEAARLLYQNDDFDQWAAGLTGDPDQSVPETGDLKIPVGKWATVIAKLPNAEEWAKHWRTDPEGYSAADLEAADQEEGFYERVFGLSNAEAAAAATPEQVESAKRVEQDVYGQLIATGRYRDTDAQAQAQFMAKVFGTLANREGLDAFALYQSYNPAIRDGTPRLAKPNTLDDRTNALVDAVRRGKIPDGPEVNGQTLLTFLKAQGGLVDEGGELRARDAGKLRPGLVSLTGLPLDTARELAVESEFLPADADINALLDAIDRELKGEAVTSPQFENTKAREFRDEALQLQAQIDEAFRDVPRDEFDALSNQEIVDRLAGDSPKGMLGRAADLVRSLYQAAFHGTPHRGIEKFSLDKIGTGEGNQAFGWGMYFASRKEVAEAYREALSQSLRGWNPSAEAAALGLSSFDAYRAQFHEVASKRELPSINAAKRLRMASIEARSESPDALRQLVDRFREATQGQTYQVDIPENDDLLDWDAPLDAQPERVQQALADLEPDLYAPDGDDYDPAERGQAIYHRLSSMRGGPRAASEWLRDAGVLGLRYFDGNSRDAGDGSRNYVIWDESAIKIDGTLYQSDLPSDARTFDEARAAASRFVGNPIQNDNGLVPATVSKTTLGKMLSASAVHKSVSPQAHARAVANLDALYRRGMLDSSHPDRNGEPTIAALHRVVAPMLDRDGSVLAVKMTVKETTGPNEANPLYSVEAVEIEKPALDAPQSGIERGPGQDRNPPQAGFSDNVRAMLDAFKRQLSQPADGGVTQNRGGIELFDPSNVTIHLFANADRSTFLHEGAHFYLQVMADLAARPDASDQVRADMDTVLRWGHIGGDTPEARLATWRAMPIPAQRHAHEAFAEGFEHYLLEGRAPSQEVASLFGKFRAWLVGIYGAMRKHRIPLSDDVRQVFDRLVATDAEIEAAKPAPALTDEQLAAAGFTPDEIAKHRERLQAAIEAAKAKLASTTLKAYERERKAWWNTERAKVREQLEDEANATPAVQAFAALRSKGGPKLNLDAVKELLPGRIVPESFPKGMTSPQGQHPDTAATVLGFSSGSELVQALVRVRDTLARLDEQAASIMRERHGDPMVDGTLPEKAMAAAHNAKQVRALEDELRMLEIMAADPTAVPEKAKPDGKARSKAPEITPERRAQIRRQAAQRAQVQRAFKAIAERKVAALKVRDLKPGEHLAAEKRAARKTIEAAGKGDFVAAAKAKREQILHASLYRASRDAQSQIEKGARYARKLEKKPARERIGKGGMLDMLDGLLGLYSFRPQSDKARDRLAGLRDWILAQRAQGVEIEAAPEVLAHVEGTAPQHYRDLTVGDFKSVIALAKQIEQQAREARLLRLAGETADREAAADDLAQTMLGALKHRGAPPISTALQDRFGERSKRAGRTAAAWLLRLRAVANWIDGPGNVNGPAHRYIIRPLDRAQAEYLDFVKRYGETIVGLFETHLKGVDLHAPVWMATLGQNLTRSDIVAIALNMGNVSNIQRVRDGMGWGDVQLADILQHLTRADVEFVQSVWDTLETLWPRIADQHERMTGVRPPKIERQPITLRLADGGQVTLPGGYFPIVYDRESTQWRAFVNADADSMFEPMAMLSLPPNGFTKQRVDRAGIPLKFDLAIIPRHLGMVLKDVTHRETLLSIQKLIRTPQVASALSETLGPEAAVMVEDKLRAIATDQLVQGGRLYGGLSKVSRTIRRHVGIMAMGLSVVSALKQVLGITAATEVMLERHGMSAPKLQALGYKRMLEKGAVAAMRTLSGEMRHRIDTADNEIRLNMQRYLAGQMAGDVKGKLGNLHDGAIAHAYIGIQYVQTYCVDIPLWMAAFEGGIRKGLVKKNADGSLSYDDAVAYADDAVISSQGAGGAKDTALIEQSIPFVEWLTMFYSYGSTYLNRQVSMGRQMGKSIEGGLPRVAAELPLLSARVAALAILPVVAEEMINILVGASKGAGDEDEDGDKDDWEDRAWHFGKRVAAFQAYGIPGLRDYFGAKYGFRLSPVQSIPDAVSKVGRNAEKLMGGEEVEARKVARDAVMATGYLTGLPLGGPYKHVDYLWRVYDEEEQPESVPEFAGALLVAKREQR